jgi:hypothetical protein
MVRQTAPPPRDSWQDALAEAEDLRSADFATRYRLLADACDLAFAILAARPDRQTALDYQEPIPSESATLIARLIQQGR